MCGTAAPRSGPRGCAHSRLPEHVPGLHFFVRLLRLRFAQLPGRTVLTTRKKGHEGKMCGSRMNRWHRMPFLYSLGIFASSAVIKSRSCVSSPPGATDRPLIQVFGCAHAAPGFFARFVVEISHPREKKTKKTEKWNPGLKRRIRLPS